MELKKEFFQEADKAIAEFDSVYEFFKTAKSHNAYQDGARYEKYKKQTSEDLVERFYQENHDYRRNEKRKRERRLRRKLETLDRIFEMEGWD